MATKKKALQIGAGMVGRCIVHDMISDFDFVVLDMSEENLAETKRLYPSVETVIGSATDKDLIANFPRTVTLSRRQCPARSDIW
ncbi:MAG: hypothetical protein ACLUEQ_03515 [Cloacibacillus evryensis]